MYKSTNLNESQLQAIVHRDGPALILAGPGSGKTLVITKRIKHLIKSHQIEPSEILVITFTKSAVIEMKERFLKIMKNEYAPVIFGTFHAIFFQILKQTYQYNSSNIITEKEKIDYLKQLLMQSTISFEIDNSFMESILSEISIVKNTGIPIEEYNARILEPDIFRRIYGEYSNILYTKRKVDFDDMVLACRDLLLSRIDLLSLWQDKFHYILIDEFQDINPIQYEVIKLLAKPRNNLFVVGDDDQSIYGFRGAKPEIMLDFPKHYPNCKKIILDINYRSEKSIVDASLKVINQNKDRFHKEIKTNHIEKGKVIISDFFSKQEQFLQIQDIIMNYHNTSNSYSTTNPYKNIAIIFRTNSGATFLIDRLIESQIPFTMKEKVKNIYEHFIAKDFLAYMKIAAGFQTREYLYEIMNKPKRYIGRSSVKEKNFKFIDLINFYKNKPYMSEILRKFSYDINKMNSMTPYAAICYIRKAIGYDNYVFEYANEKNVEFSNYFEIMEDILELSKGYQSIMEWEQHIKLYEEELKHLVNNEFEKDGIHLLTLHGSKGLEFPVVIIPDINENIIPHKKAITKDEIEEERRMFYVGMTRAKEELYLFYVSGNKGKEYRPSMFLNNLIKYYKKK